MRAVGPHGIKIFSARTTAPYRIMPRTLSTTSDAQARGVLSCELAVSKRLPRPSFDPMNSPMTAPMTASVTAILAPEKIDGNADGS